MDAGRQYLAELHTKLSGTKLDENGQVVADKRSPLEADFTNSPGRGRPRNDEDREVAREFKARGMRWKDIAAEMEKKTGHPWTVDACRALLRNR